MTEQLDSSEDQELFCLYCGRSKIGYEPGDCLFKGLHCEKLKINRGHVCREEGLHFNCDAFTDCRDSMDSRGHYWITREEMEKNQSPFELPPHAPEKELIAHEEIKWIISIVDLVNHASNMANALGMESSTIQLECMAKVAMDNLLDEFKQKERDPILDLMQKLLDTGNARKDQRALIDVAPIRSVMSDRIWRTSWSLHAQISKANQNGWAFYETIHLMLEQRDWWTASDVLWLIAVAVDYIEERV